MDDSGRSAQSKPVVLTLTNAYLPGYRGGGPARTILALVQRLQPELDLRVVTPDRERGENAPYKGIMSGAWQTVEAGQVFYLPSASPGALVAGLASLLREASYDVLYLNSFFHPIFTTLPLLLRKVGAARRVPVVLAPRGELAEGALSVRGRKKRAYLRSVPHTGLYDDVVWHASTELERAEILRWFPRAVVHVACDLSPVAAVHASTTERSKRAGRARLVFVSRIVPKKNLDYAVRVLAGVRGEVDLDVYGPIEDREHYRAVLGEIARLPANIRVRHIGELRPEQVCDAFSRYDAFLFPTRGENFGHVIFESLAAGCPVILSDRTPWNELAVRDAGASLPLERPEAFTAAVQRVVDRDDDEARRVSENAVGYARAFMDRDEHVASNRVMFQSVAREAAGSMP